MLAISEQFYSIQGEGPSVGTPAVFCRLKGCNLTCGGVDTVKTQALDSGATWRCDTIEVWLKGERRSSESILDEWENNAWVPLLSRGAHLVVTGGEPLLQQDGLVSFLSMFRQRYGFYPYIEVETNATIAPVLELIECVSQFNVSPKLANSGMSLDKCCVPDVMEGFASNSKAIFKFVVSEESDVKACIQSYIDPFSISADRVFLMPAADSREQYAVLEPVVVELCKQFNFRYSQRLHIQLWDKKTGV